MNDAPGDSRSARDPYPAYAAMRSECPVQAVASGASGRVSYLVTGYAEARQALGDERLSKDTAAFFAGRDTKRRLHPAVAHTMLASDPPRHTRLRKLVTGAFTSGAVAGIRPFITRLTDELLDRWPVGGTVDLVAGLAVPLPVMVICELLGVPEADRPKVRHWSAELFAAGRPDRGDAASHAVAAYMTGLIASKRLRPGDSLLDRLIAARDGEDRLDEEELVSLAVLLLVAGHETTTHFLGNAALALLRHPPRRNACAPTRTPSRTHWTSCSASTPRSAPPPSGSPRKPSPWAKRRSPRASPYSSPSEPPTATRSASRPRTGSTWTGKRPVISASATASTGASEHRSRKPRPRSPCARSWSVSRTSGSPYRRTGWPGGRPGSFAGWTLFPSCSELRCSSRVPRRLSRGRVSPVSGGAASAGPPPCSRRAPLPGRSCPGPP